MHYVDIPWKFLKMNVQHVTAPSEEVLTLQGDYSKTHQKLGWKPKVKLEELVMMMVDMDLEIVK